MEEDGTIGRRGHREKVIVLELVVDGRVGDLNWHTLRVRGWETRRLGGWQTDRPGEWWTGRLADYQPSRLTD